MKTKTIIWLFPWMITVMWLLLSGCKKEDNNDNNNIANDGTVTDIDGNTYHTVTIGSQLWMVENLKTTRYRNGVVIPNVIDSVTWGGLPTGACCDFDNIPANSLIYGKMYNWYAVESGLLAPAEWHVPTDEEWMTLINFLGGKGIAGGKMKEAGTAHWRSPNKDATNSSGFTALPGGYRTRYSSFDGLKFTGRFWSVSQYSTWEAFGLYLLSDTAGAYKFDIHKTYGLSVRCLAD